MKSLSNSKFGILKYMIAHESATKADLSRNLNLSMPTVISNVNEMLEQKLLIEIGEMKSNGGRKAKAYGIRKDYCFALGIDITRRHVGMVLVNLNGEIVKQERIRKEFVSDITYCRGLERQLFDFYFGEVEKEKILGVGISIPGIINQKEKLLVKSHALNLENYSLKMLEQMIPFQVYFENDANAAMLAENLETEENVIYVSLNNTLGGGVYINSELYTGKWQKAGEFGHMILHPGGRKCYCGKLGCADAYCAASVLTHNGQEPLEKFMNQIDKNQETNIIWQEYLEDLAILISNLRMSFDADIILGGDVGGYLADNMTDLEDKLFKYNFFDKDVSYIKNCSYKKEASAVGVAKYFLRQFMETIL
ncbi:ROK family transcriptional regulator [Ruminococcus sp. 2227st1_E6_2227SCRN_220401]|uniref:ROK family protein n=1 Tax=unclassified Ruminococcus TaxID=2608920 RepID=UPI00319DD8FC